MSLRKEALATVDGGAVSAGEAMESRSWSVRSM